jgi:hypothetical protein
MARRFYPLLLALFVLTACSLATAAEPELSGHWKVVLLGDESQPTLWLVKLDVKDGKWSGKVVATASEKLQDVTLEDLSVSDDKISFNLKGSGESFSFEGTAPKESGKPIRGNFMLGRSLIPAQLEPTKVTSFDSFELSKEILAGPPNDLRYFNAGLGLLQDATEKKAKPEEVRSWAEKTYKSADLFGARWQRDVSMRIANALSPQAAYAELAVTYARRAERMVDAKESAATHFRVQTALYHALKKAGEGSGEKAAEFAREAKKVDAKLDAIDLSVKPEKFAGRKGKGDRTLLLELFTGTACPPCVAASLAADAIAQTYKPTDVIVIAYPCQNAGPNPLGGAEVDIRQEFYDKAAAATPAVFVSGAPVQNAGGPLEVAETEYRGYRRILDGALDKDDREAGARIKLSATRKGSKVNISTDVSDIAKPSESLRLRLALVEEDIHYAGANGLRFHHNIVRAMPGGGPKGFPLAKKSDRQEIRVDLDDLRKGLNKYLDDITKEKPQFTFPQRPMDFKNLKIIAFVQNDETGEIVQAAQADVRSEKE